MFQSLKEKIKSQTGQDPLTVNYKNNASSRNSVSSNRRTSDELSQLEQKDAEINALKIELSESRNRIRKLEEQVIALEESFKVNQVQKEILYDDQDKIQNIQMQEINKLKSMLVFREQEALDHMNQSKNNETQIECLKNEMSRIKNIEPLYEEAKDELENLRRSSQLEKNQLITQLSANEEELRHLKIKLEILEQGRALINSSGSENDKVNLLLKECKTLRSRLEEAHEMLHDVKSNWSSQNLSLETQVQRLSRQVAEETAEKRRSIEAKELLQQKIKKLEFDMIKIKDELKQRDNKIKLMSEEIDELNSSLRELRLESEEEIEFLRSKAAFQESELSKAREELDGITLRTTDDVEEYGKQILALQQENNELKNTLLLEREENVKLQLKHAQISQDISKLHIERDSGIEEKIKTLESELEKRLHDIDSLNDKISELTEETINLNELRTQIDRLNAEVIDKNKAIKILNQRLFDMKKTLHEEIKNSHSGSSGSISCNAPAILTPVNYSDNNLLTSMVFNGRKTTSNISGPVVMDEVKFSYLKHVILKFVTSRELEAKHLIRAVSTLLYLTDSEEKFLYEALEYRRSWFGTKPEFSMSLL